MRLRCLSVMAMVCLGISMSGLSPLSDAGTCRAETVAVSVVREDAAAKRSAPDGPKHALLVGCTHYEGAASKLRGPANDVKLMQRVLAGRFGFQAADIDRLVGWPDDVSRRPTYANIVKAFERLVKKAGPNSQIVILLSGHGSQVPVPKSQRSLLDPANREIDGMDEVFLPSDCKSWENDTIPNSISDNQIAAWLERMKAKGASVWLICDCCHSGTLSKSGGAPAHGIRWRKLDPHTQLGIPQEVLRAARKRAAALGGSKGVARLESPVKIDVKKPGTGHVVAFFAAQPFERAPEMPRPRGADRSDPTKVHGLLTYTLVRALEQNRFSMTYRELSQKILAAYRAENMISLPTPFSDGDVEREVLGLGTWPKRSRILLERHGGKLFATSGELQGLVNGSILRVHPPAGSDAKEKRLGYVKVVKAGVALSEVKPCEFKEKDKTFSAVEEKTLPNLGQCEVVYRATADMRINLAMTAAKNTGPRTALLEQVWKKLPSAVRAMVRKSPVAEADWILHTAADRFELRRNNADSPSTAGMKDIVVTYRPKEPKQFVQQLTEDLRKIFVYENVRRVSEVAGAAGKSGSRKPRFRFSAKRIAFGKTIAELQNRAEVLFPRDILVLRFDNTRNLEDVWVTVLFLDSEYGISVFDPRTIENGKKGRPYRIQITDSSFGSEAIVVFVQNLKAFGERQRFEFLAQKPLGQYSTSAKGGERDTSSAKTPFSLLLATTVRGKGAKGFPVGHPANPIVFTYSWITQPRP